MRARPRSRGSTAISFDASRVRAETKPEERKALLVVEKNWEFLALLLLALAG